VSTPTRCERCGRFTSGVFYVSDYPHIPSPSELCARCACRCSGGTYCPVHTTSQQDLYDNLTEGQLADALAADQEYEP